MCPDPSLLVAYLDRTLFHRDAADVDAHVATCANCTDLLAAMRRVRAAEQRSMRSRWIAAAAVAAVAIGGAGAWIVSGRSNAAATRESVTPPKEAPSPPLSLAVTSSPPLPPSSVNGHRTPDKPARAEAKSVEKPSTKAQTVERADSAPIEGDVIVRCRNANR